MKKEEFLESEVRQKIIEALRVDLVGPSAKDEVLDENPMYEYLTGMLYPNTMCEDIIEQEISEDNFDSNYEPKPDEDDNEPMISAKFTQQSSIGISFYLKKTTNYIVADISWGEYNKQTSKYLNSKNEEKTTYVFPRKDMSSEIIIDLSQFKKSCDFKLPEDENIVVRINKIGLQNEYQLITAYLTNRRLKSDSELETIMFQACLTIHASRNDAIFVSEAECKSILSEEEFFYRKRPIFGRGRGCSAMWYSDDNKRATKIYTSFIPEYELPGVGSSIHDFDKLHFLMSFMAKPANKDLTIERLVKLRDSYKTWIDSKLIKSELMEQESFKNKVGDSVIAKCVNSLQRMSDGIDILKNDELAFDAFCFMNSVMSLQRSINNYSKTHGKGIECKYEEFVNPKDEKNQFCWRPFQIAFILINIKSIIQPQCNEREIVDLLYFPTGGGKTEAYLGLIAFVIAVRRLSSKPDDEFEKDGGVTAILRYTLRLLTAQQRDRLTKMVIAAEMMRLCKYPKFGKTPITIGFWVGGGLTPNKFSDLEYDPNNQDKSIKNRDLLYKQLLTCPFCGGKLYEHNYHIDFDKKRVKIYCDDPNCLFYKYGNTKGQNKEPMHLPVSLVDEEIYKTCPTIILATVDKFTALPWKVETNSIFGRVNGYCDRDGYVSQGEKHHSYRAKGDLPKAETKDIKPFAPPELIVQDELHLISGPLGTIYGAYETMIQKLCSYQTGGREILPKYIVSTATIKNADEQIKCLYGRTKTAQFPPNGFETGDCFFIKEIPVDQHPFRKYVGISANGKSVKTTVLRVYAVLLQTVHELSKDPKYKECLDPYYTLVGYFNSIRELGGTVRLLQDDIPKRINRLVKKYNYTSERFLREKVEITSRINSSRISEKLQQLETPMGKDKCPDTAIATNMIAVGMDVDRLGLMAVMGQPKQNSEYIQATSRIGRQHPGIVFTIYNPYRPRDLSHYENFVGYHEQLYRFVEGTTATPFAARARDRVLHALVISAIRLLFPDFAENIKANDIAMLTETQKEEVTKIILDRLSIVNPLARQDTKNEIEYFLAEWKELASKDKKLYYYILNTDKYNRLMNYYSEDCLKTEKGTLNSMREVEASAKLYYFEED